MTNQTWYPTQLLDAPCHLPIVGKTIMSAVFYLDNSGYTRFRLTLDDNTIVEAIEQRQAGEFAVELTT